MIEPLIGPSEQAKARIPGDDAVMRRVMVTFWVASVVTIQVAGFVYQSLRPPESLYLFAFWLGGVCAG